MSWGAFIAGIIVATLINPTHEKWIEKWKKKGSDVKEINKRYFKKFKNKFIVIGVSLMLVLLLLLFVEQC
jgi:hypothetical protein